MFEKPKVTFVQNQKVESEREITGYEAEEILRKYGYQNPSYNSNNNSKDTNDNLTFEEMIMQQKAKENEEKIRIQNKLNGPKPITFNSNNYESDVRYGSDDELGFGFKIEVTTDMKLPKY
jgi:hypothetical protein